MHLLRALKDRVIRRQYQRLHKQIRAADPEKLIDAATRKVVPAFQRAARRVPAYRELLHRHGLDPATIRDLADFQQEVPVLDKQSVFENHELHDLCLDGHVDDVALFFSSSGATRRFSYGVETYADAGRAALQLEFFLQEYFNALDCRTLLVNCLPMGVKLHTRTLPLVESSVRADVIWALLNKLRRDFDQVILIGEHPFLKTVIEEGAENGVPWQEMRVHVVTGAEYVAEGFRSYVGGYLGLDFEDPAGGMLLVNFGLSELSVSICRECPETIRLRRKASDDPVLRRVLYGCETPVAPNIMQYNPGEVFLETVPGPDAERANLVVTTLDSCRKLPLIRYNTGDVAELLSYQDLKSRLAAAGCEELLPTVKLPFIIPWGKCSRTVLSAEQSVGVEQIKEALYQAPEVARSLTGNFRLVKEGEGTGRLMLQLRAGREWNAGLAEALKQSLAAWQVPEVVLDVLPYREFPYGMAHDFERKNQYL